MDPIDYSCIHLSVVLDKLQRVLHSLNITSADEIITKVATGVSTTVLVSNPVQDSSVAETGLGQVGIISGIMPDLTSKTNTELSSIIYGVVLAIFFMVFAVKNMSTRRYTTVSDVLVFRMIYPIISSVFVFPLMMINTFLRVCFALVGRISFKEILSNACYSIEKHIDHNISVYIGEPSINSEYQPINSEHIDHSGCSHDSDL